MKRGDVIARDVPYTTEPGFYHQEGTINWVIDGDCAVRFADGNYAIFTIATEEPQWKVIVESVPSYQSSVENLTDEELRKSIDDLRAQRVSIPSKSRKISTKEVVDKDDPMAVALASMPADKKLELMKKLGMVD